VDESDNSGKSASTLKLKLFHDSNPVVEFDLYLKFILEEKLALIVTGVE
tara:strand:- start:892 stop:1038 length:147 start_codon:yes stop_codon:yes gene_type:complete